MLHISSRRVDAHLGEWQIDGNVFQRGFVFPRAGTVPKIVVGLL
jgi:hypothetical protein